LIFGKEPGGLWLPFFLGLAMITETLGRLKVLFDSRFGGEVQGALRPPATADAVNRAEAVFGVELPYALRAAYLCFDGVDRNVLMDSPGRIPPLILPYYDWANLDRVVSSWRQQRVLQGLNSGILGMIDPPTAETRVLDVAVLHEKWIPIGYSGTESFAAIDLNPGPAGKVGQLITVDPMAAKTEVISESFEGYLQALTEALQSGALFSHQGDWFSKTSGTRAYALPAR